MAIDSNVALRVECCEAVAIARRDAIGSIIYTDNLMLQIAQAFADDMAAKGYFDHKDKSGRWPWDRLGLAGYQWAEAGEDIAWGQTSGKQVVADWRNSPGHWAQIIHPGYTAFGVGCAMGKGGRLFWVLDVARPVSGFGRRGLQVPVRRRGEMTTNSLNGDRMSWCAASID